MNAKVGSDASTPSVPWTSMKKKIESPSVPKNDAITVAISTSGATIACSRIPRMIVMTSRVTGTITRMSRSAASLKSCCTALPAPTSAVAPPGSSLTLSRSVSTRASAASDAPPDPLTPLEFLLRPAGDGLAARPEAAPPHDREQGRQQCEAREKHGGHADRRHRSERVGRARVGQQQHEHRRDH